MGLCLRYNRPNIRYTFCNKAFLEGQMVRMKPTTKIAMKNLPFCCSGPSSFLCIVIFFYTVFSASATTSH